MIIKSIGQTVTLFLLKRAEKWHAVLPEESSFPDSTTNTRLDKSLERSQQIFISLSHNSCTFVCWFISAESAVQLFENVMSSQSCCLWQQCWYHRPSSSVTHYNGYFTQILSPLSLSTTLSPSFTSLCLFFLSLFSQLDSRDNNAVTVWFSQILFSNQLANKHCCPSLFHLFPLYFSLSLYSSRPKALSLRRSHR